MATKDTTAPQKNATPKKKKDTKIASGVLHVHTTDNNTVIALVDENGNRVL